MPLPSGTTYRDLSEVPFPQIDQPRTITLCGCDNIAISILASPGAAEYYRKNGGLWPDMDAELTGRALTGQSDSALVAAAKNGENRAFEILVERHEARIFSLAFYITRNREDAQDVVQRSVQKAFSYLHNFRGKSSFSTWLTRIAINEALMSRGVQNYFGSIRRNLRGSMTAL